MTISKARSQISLQTVAVATQNQVSCDLAGETVILNLDSGIYFGLDPVGTRAWELLQEAMSINDLCEVLLQEYDVEPEQCQQDVLALLERMVREGLLEIRDEAST